MDSISEYQDSLQTTTVSDAVGDEADKDGQLGTMRSCDCCNADFLSNASFITICQECRNSVVDKVNDSNLNDGPTNSSVPPEMTASSTSSTVIEQSDSTESTSKQLLNILQ